MTFVRMGIFMKNIRVTGAYTKHETQILSPQAQYICMMIS
jgi:hypothetical protein